MRVCIDSWIDSIYFNCHVSDIHLDKMSSHRNTPQPVIFHFPAYIYLINQKNDSCSSSSREAFSKWELKEALQLVVIFTAVQRLKWAIYIFSLRCCEKQLKAYGMSYSLLMAAVWPRSRGPSFWGHVQVCRGAITTEPWSHTQTLIISTSPPSTFSAGNNALLPHWMSHPAHLYELHYFSTISFSFPLLLPLSFCFLESLLCDVLISSVPREHSFSRHQSSNAAMAELWKANGAKEVRFHSLQPSPVNSWCHLTDRLLGHSASDYLTQSVSQRNIL